MKREEIADLMAFVVVAEERSFTRAVDWPPESPDNQYHLNK